MSWRALADKNLKKALLNFLLNRMARGLPPQDLVAKVSQLLVEHDILDSSEGILLRRLLTFKNKDVRDVMVPRGEIFAVAGDAQLRDVMPSLSKHGFSRVPVYEKNLDNIVGVLYVKDVAFFFPPDGDVPVSQLMREAHFVPETMTLQQLYAEFTRHRVHIAMVIDEYGSVTGLVTMEDLLEEIFGEIQDEYDSESDPEIQMVGENAALVQGRVNIDRLFEIFGVSIEAEGIDTVNGLLSQLKNGIPQKGDVFEYYTLVFRVLESDERQAKKVLIRRVN